MLHQAHCMSPTRALIRLKGMRRARTQVKLLLATVVLESATRFCLISKESTIIRHHLA